MTERIKTINANYFGKGIAVRYFDFKPKIDYTRHYGVGYADAALNEDIGRLRELWEKVQASRARDAIYDYLRAAYELVLCWKAEDQEGQRARRALKINGLAPSNDPEPLRRLLRQACRPRNWIGGSSASTHVFYVSRPGLIVIPRI